MTFSRIIVVILAQLIGLSDAGPVRHNKLFYGSLETGMKAGQVGTLYPGLQEKLSGSFIEMEERSETDFSIKIERPKKMEIFDRFIKRIPVKILQASEADRCASPQQMVFLSLPSAQGMVPTQRLYSYDYLVCAGGGEVSPERLLEKYMEKYGNYDKKDFDRNQHIYNNVKKRYQVAVKPVKTADGKVGLVVTITDELVFKHVYDAWRARVRQVEKTAKEEL